MTDDTYELKEAYLERVMDKGVDSLPFEVGCKWCRGGLVPGDWVPYGSTSAQLPNTWCDCVYEKGMQWIDEAFDAGELVLLADGTLGES